MLDLVTAGEVFDDLVFYNLVRMPAAGRELKTDAFVHAVGGGAAIAGVTAARLGARVRIVTALSREAAARLRRERVGLTNLRRAGEPAALTVALSTRRDRRFITFTGMHDRLPARVRAALARTRARHVHLAMHPSRCASWLRVLARLRARGSTISWDFGWNPDLPRDPKFGALIEALDYLFVNRAEARAYRSRPSSGVTVVTLGAEGCRAIARGVDLRIAAPRVRVVDTTGAGDVFSGAFLAARLRGEPLDRALRVATRLAAQSTRHPGGFA